MGVSGIAVLSFFFKRYFGHFDFNVRYYGIIQPRGTRFFILLANGIRYSSLTSPVKCRSIFGRR